ncbi:MAG: peptide deformylase [bacterium]|nr:peptide deformylase [bacterium]
MAKIVTIQNKKDEKFLRQKTANFDFTQFSKKEIRELIKRMRRDMHEADGIGLSANQIGLDTRIFVAIVESKFYAIFNPELIQLSKETTAIDEGCLSVPGVYGLVERPARVTLKGLDANGHVIKIKAWGLLARVFQHEMDHLNGGLFIDKAKQVERVPLVK